MGGAMQAGGPASAAFGRSINAGLAGKPGSENTNGTLFGFIPFSKGWIPQASNLGQALDIADSLQASVDATAAANAAKLPGKPPDLTDLAVRAARTQVAGGGGYGSTMFTGPSGLSGKAPTKKSTLLGGW